MGVLFMTITTVSNEQLAKEYVDGVFEQLKQQNSHQAEFLQAAEEIFISLVPVFAQHPEYIKANILSRIVEPDRIISFRVAWQDDNHDIAVLYTIATIHLYLIVIILPCYTERNNTIWLHNTR